MMGLSCLPKKHSQKAQASSVRIPLSKDELDCMPESAFSDSYESAMGNGRSSPSKWRTSPTKQFPPSHLLPTPSSISMKYKPGGSNFDSPVSSNGNGPINRLELVPPGTSRLVASPTKPETNSVSNSSNFVEVSTSGKNKLEQISSISTTNQQRLSRSNSPIKSPVAINSFAQNPIEPFCSKESCSGVESAQIVTAFGNVCPVDGTSDTNTTTVIHWTLPSTSNVALSPPQSPSKKAANSFNHTETPSPMSTSILANLSWYRDRDGRTGYRPDEWSSLPNIQANAIKRSPPREVPSNGSNNAKPQTNHSKASLNGFSTLPTPPSQNSFIAKVPSTGYSSLPTPIKHQLKRSDRVMAGLSSLLPPTSTTTRNDVPQPNDTNGLLNSAGRKFSKKATILALGQRSGYQPVVSDIDDAPDHDPHFYNHANGIDQSASNRGSGSPHKFVTFSDKVQINEIERSEDEYDDEDYAESEDVRVTDSNGIVHIEFDDFLNGRDMVKVGLDHQETKGQFDNQSKLKNAFDREKNTNQLNTHNEARIPSPIYKAASYSQPSNSSSYPSTLAKSNSACAESEWPFAELANGMAMTQRNQRVNGSEYNKGSDQLEQVIQQFFRSCDTIVRLGGATASQQPLPPSNSPPIKRQNNARPLRLPLPTTTAKILLPPNGLVNRAIPPQRSVMSGSPNLAPKRHANGGHELGSPDEPQQRSFYDNVTPTESGAKNKNPFTVNASSLESSITSPPIVYDHVPIGVRGREARQDEWLRTKFVAKSYTHDPEAAKVESRQNTPNTPQNDINRSIASRVQSADPPMYRGNNIANFAQNGQSSTNGFGRRSASKIPTAISRIPTRRTEALRSASGDSITFITEKERRIFNS